MYPALITDICGDSQEPRKYHIGPHYAQKALIQFAEATIKISGYQQKADARRDVLWTRNIHNKNKNDKDIQVFPWQPPALVKKARQYFYYQ